MNKIYRSIIIIAQLNISDSKKVCTYRHDSFRNVCDLFPADPSVLKRVCITSPPRRRHCILLKCKHGVNLFLHTTVVSVVLLNVMLLQLFNRAKPRTPSGTLCMLAEANVWWWQRWWYHDDNISWFRIDNDSPILPPTFQFLLFTIITEPNLDSYLGGLGEPDAGCQQLDQIWTPLCNSAWNRNRYCNRGNPWCRLEKCGKGLINLIKRFGVCINPAPCYWYDSTMIHTIHRRLFEAAPHVPGGQLAT